MNFPEEPIFLKETGAVIVSRAEYDRLLAVEKQRNEMLALLECFCDNTEAMNLITGYMPDETSLVCRARAAIARAKGEKK